MKEDYLQHLSNMEKLCDDFRLFTINNWFKDSTGHVQDRVDIDATYFCFAPAYQQHLDIIRGIVDICDMFGIQHLERRKEELVRRVHFLEDYTRVQKRTEFDYNLKKIKTYFGQVRDKIEEKISLVNPAEMDRLNEAIHCFIEGCYHSAVAMSVSAIEFRLYSLMMSTCPNPKLEELTLGQLIREYLDNKQKYGKVIPKKHEPLLEHSNTYRVFSVHPKKEEINKPIANSILNMTFTFLLDKNLARKVGISKEEEQ